MLRQWCYTQTFQNVVFLLHRDIHLFPFICINQRFLEIFTMISGLTKRFFVFILMLLPCSLINISYVLKSNYIHITNILIWYFIIFIIFFLSKRIVLLIQWWHELIGQTQLNFLILNLIIQRYFRVIVLLLWTIKRILFTDKNTVFLIWINYTWMKRNKQYISTWVIVDHVYFQTHFLSLIWNFLFWMI